MGFALAGLGAVLFSGKAIVVKMIYQHDVDALIVIGYRMMLSLPFFLLVGLMQARQARKGKIPRLTAKESAQVAFLGFIGYYLASYLDFLGLQYISVSLERLILFLSPTFVLLISAFYLKKSIAWGQWLALLLSYIGVGLVLVQDFSLTGKNVFLGSSLVLASALSYACYLIGAGELIKRVGSIRLVAYAMSVSAVISMFHFFAVHSWEGLIQPFPVYTLSMVHAVLNTVLPTFMIMIAVGRIGASMTAQLGLLGPVSLVFLAWWLIDEPITTLQLLGTACVLAGAMVLGRGRR
jgi:drug/metabolite transporter (DMT)-like permease